MSDIVERLLTTRVVKTCDGGEHVLINPDGPEAADEIARLRAKNERLRHTAGDLVQHIDWLTSGLPQMLEDASLTDEEGLIGAAVDAANSARKALEDSHD